jgi:predicted secreted Zn-dependent protease
MSEEFALFAVAVLGALTVCASDIERFWVHWRYLRDARRHAARVQQRANAAARELRRELEVTRGDPD